MVFLLRVKSKGVLSIFANCKEECGLDVSGLICVVFWTVEIKIGVF
jgi:hypothetical protein